MMTTVIAINGNPRRKGNTSILLRHAMEAVEMDQEGIRRAHDTGKNMAWLLQRSGVKNE